MSKIQDALEFLREAANLKKLMREGNASSNDVKKILRAVIKHKVKVHKVARTLVADIKREKKKIERIAREAKSFKKSTNSLVESIDQHVRALDTRFAKKENVKTLEKRSQKQLREAIADVYENMPEIPEYESNTPEVVREKLESLEADDRLGIDAIKDLREELQKIRKLKTRGARGGGVMGRHLVKDIDLSSQLNGSKKTFDIPAVYSIISVDLSSFPYGSCRKNVDYTYTQTSITFTDEINAATQLSAGQSCVLTVMTM